MYLKNIEVQGFKSFAQKINFEFHNGITAIVGPNGSGKSNVADAVRWVLGEQSAKQLRGGSMQDVIFSGTENRKPLSFASVAITLDNSEHKLPVDFQEVTVTRRLYRSGESEYLLNGSSCHLRDINEMFYDTGIGKEGYSIIGQGQIDRILSGKPEERRELFDEAAGIVKFKRRKNTTLKKLEEEQQNLVRVTDILSELTRQLGPLEKQSETAKIYLSRKENLKELDVNLFLLENNSREKVLEELGLKSETAGRELLETTRAYEKTKEEYDRLEKSLEELNEKTEALRAESQEKVLGKQQLEGQIGVLEEQIASVRQSEEHYSHRLTAIEEDTKKKEKDRTAFEEERNQYRGSLRKIREKTDQAEKNLARIQENVQQSSEAVEDGKNEIIELLNARSTTKGEARRSDTLMEQMEIRGAEISRRLLQLKTEEEQQRVSMEKARASLQEMTDRIKSMREEGERLDLSVASLGEELKKQNEQMDIGQRAYHREESRLESMRNMAERYDGYGNSIRRVMEQKKNRPGIRGVAADLIHVEKKYEIAIETALGGSIQNIVTDTQETAKAMIDFLKKNRYGRATFLPLDSISPRGEFGPAAALKETGVIGLACDLVAVEKEYQKLSRYLLGRVLVVDHIDHAIAIGRKYRHSLRMVTLEGESLSPGGSMTGGAFKNNSNLLGRRREIQELESSVRALKKDMEEMQVSIRENRDRRNTLRESQVNLQENLRRQSVAQNTAQILVRQLEEKDREIQKSRARVLREQEETGKQVRELRRENERIQTELAASRKDESELETYIEDRQRDLEKWKEE
ncbi:MAG: chromosome segregation protein SMC, partial [Clostridiales bacterium]|nr:chromosome segregation protein SMC [Clostridiales bacterium]